MIYFELFIAFFSIGILGFGGGYATLPLIEHQVVEVNQWISAAEFIDLITISQMTPGPIAINASTFVGSQVAGIGGSIVATLGCIMPSCIIVTIISFIYFKYRHLNAMKEIFNILRPAVVSLILGAGIGIVQNALFTPEKVMNLSNLRIDMLLIFIASILCIQVKKMNPIKVMVLAGFVKLGISLIV